MTLKSNRTAEQQLGAVANGMWNEVDEQTSENLRTKLEAILTRLQATSKPIRYERRFTGSYDKYERGADERLTRQNSGAVAKPKHGQVLG
jgi:hypothetical protein